MKYSFRQMLSFVRTLAIIFFFAICWHLISIAFGAPFLQLFRETFLFSFVLSLCTTIPNLLAFKNFDDFSRVFFDYQIERNSELIAYYSVFGSIFGAWFGAIPIPLDWDRSWQKWPVTCLVGTLIGCFGGFLFSNFLIFWRKKKGRKSKIV